MELPEQRRSAYDGASFIRQVSSPIRQNRQNHQISASEFRQLVLGFAETKFVKISLIVQKV